ncbi:MAG: PEP-CTERM sorting domain-containing protein [Verrucomicrobiota bacterium]|nr:PEP-CTERM sorting domain-containing protein [Verrucomicrobiota bacterium]
MFKTAPSTLKVLGLSLLSFVACASVSYGDTYFNSGFLSAGAGSPTAHATGQSTTGSGLQYYNLYQITVTTSGSYTFELSGLNTGGATSNALDTWLGIFTNTFVPPSPGAPTSSNDDFTGALTVLPGPYAAQGLTATATGFTGAQPSSRITPFTLTAGTTYFLYVSSFRDTTFVGTGTTAQATGAYYLGLSGTGTVVVTPVVRTQIPEPSTVALLSLAGVGAFGLAVSRKRKVA